MSLSWDAIYYDGKTANSQKTKIRFEEGAIVFHDVNGQEHFWPYKKINLEKLDKDTRITVQSERDAVLVLPASTLAALIEKVPHLRKDRRDRRKFAGLIAGLTLAAASTATFIFAVIPYMATRLAHSTPIQTEQQIGENLASQVMLILRPCKNDRAHAILEPVVQEFARAGGIEHNVKLTLLRTSMANALALPGGQMMATRGFLDAVDNDQEAFWAVVSHELAHVKNRDGMVALYRNLGLSTLLEIVTGGSGAAQQAILVGGQITNLSYTRSQERAADELAYEIMERMSLNPAALGRALDALVGTTNHSHKDGSHVDFKWPEWLQTHPDTDGRIERAMAQDTKRRHALPLSEADWEIVRHACEG